MKKAFVILFVVGPLGLATSLIINGIMSESLPLFTDSINDSRFLDQTYEAAKEYCEDIRNSITNQERSYDECMNMVEDWLK